MSNTNLIALSNELGALTEAGGAAVVQVLGARRSASGVAHGPDTIITTARAIGREDGLRVRTGAGDTVDADLVGWDPSTGLALLRARSPLAVPPPSIAETEPRAGEIVVAIARSWSNAVTASAGIVAVVGGPLRTGRGRQIARVIRVTARMHDGFAGGAVFDAAGRLVGVATAAAIRGYGVVIPASIAWASASQLLASGTPRRGFVGLAVQPVQLNPSGPSGGRQRALLIVGVTAGSPAEQAGLIVGDVLLEFGSRATETADDLLDSLTGSAVGQSIAARILRGGTPREVQLTVAERG